MLPNKNIILRFPPAASSSNSSSSTLTSSSSIGIIDQAEETYQLLELPPEILKQVESLKGKEKELGGGSGAGGAVFPLTIKGRPSDDAVLCTPTTTFQLRTVGISNSLLVCRTPQTQSTANDDRSSSTPLASDRPTLQLRDTCHQILECVPIAANLERIRTILRDSAWEGLGSSSTSLGKRKRGQKAENGNCNGKGGRAGRTWTRDQLASVIQASDAELERGLKERNVVEVEGRMLLLPPKALKELLTLLLSLLTIHHTHPSSPNIAPAKAIIDALTNEYDVPSQLCRPVLNLFGEHELSAPRSPTSEAHQQQAEEKKEEEEEEEEWKADVQAIVRQVGNGLLIGVKDRRSDEFVEEWKAEVGDMWADNVDLKLLEGEHLLTPPPASISSFTSPSPLITHFPLSQLPLNPAQRFADLFLTRARWRPEEILPFLKGLTRDGDTKERDKLVQKFVRVVKEGGKDGGAWWYPRRTG
ncbi:hypothetical protein IAU59_003621 [Kwoniella sp. CBS 9459]